MRKGSIILLSLYIIFCLSACNASPVSKTFTCNELSITLTDEFKEKNDGYLTLYTTDIKIVVQATPTESVNHIALEEYASLLSESIGFLSPLDTDTIADAVAYEYGLDGDGFENSRCLLALYKTDSHYYNVTFSCAEDTYESNREMFIDWMDSVKIG